MTTASPPGLCHRGMARPGGLSVARAPGPHFSAAEKSAGELKLDRWVVRLELLGGVRVQGNWTRAAEVGETAFDPSIEEFTFHSRTLS